MKRVINKHIVYITIIFLILLLSIIVCMSKESISETAMDNVSFASSLVSIVLAVISIVISVIASFATQNNLGGFNEIERNLKDSIVRLSNIEETVNKTNKNIAILVQTSEKQIEASLKEEAKELNSEVTPNNTNENLNYEKINKIQTQAIDFVAHKYGIEIYPGKYDFREKGIRGRIEFDGLGERGGHLYVFDVMLIRNKIPEDKIQVIYNEFLEVRQRLNNLKLIIIFVYLNNIKDSNQFQKFKNDDIKIVSININELDV